jgi:single-stranded DNA-binding protein
MSAIYLEGRIIGVPVVATTSKGGSLVKFLLEVESQRQTRQGPVSEIQTLPIAAFGHVADAVAAVHQYDKIIIGVRLSGTEFKTSDGTIKRGVQLVAESVAAPVPRRKTVEAGDLATR